MSTTSWEQLARQNSTHPKPSYSYSLPLALLPPALPSYQRANSSLICPISCTILLCSPILPRTCVHSSASTNSTLPRLLKCQTSACQLCESSLSPPATTLTARSQSVEASIKTRCFASDHTTPFSHKHIA